MGRRSILALLSILALACPASALELTVAKESFGPNENIEVFAHNESTELVCFPSSAPYVARNLDTGQIVQFIGLAVMIPLDPGERTWFEILGGELGPGPWQLEFHYWEDEEDQCCALVEFEIRASGGAPTAGSSVGQLKDHYRD